MLAHLNLKNFAIVESLNLDFQNGMTALTGETGAGKSIIIDALALVLGARGSNSIIRHGQTRADISVIFNIQNIPQASLWLQENAFDNGESEVLLRRSLNKDKPSRQAINGQPCTQAQMRELGELLVNIHGQHEHQNLLKREQQRFLLDRYGKHDALIAPVQKCYHEWREIKHQLQNLNSAPGEQQAKCELLRYQVKELQDLALSENEFTELEHEHKQLAHGEHLQENVQQALQCLDSDNSGNAQQLILQAQQQLQAIIKIAPELQSCVDLLSSANIELQEASHELHSYAASIQIDAARLFTLEQRLNQIHNIARKHHIEPEKLLDIQQKLEQQLQQLEHADEFKAKLQQQLNTLEQDYWQKAEKLSQARKTSAKKLSQLISESMQTLGMQGGKFNIDLQKQTELNAFGGEKIEFQVTANPGQPLQALSKVASGGEMSRISLALQMITAQKDDTPTLIFDEVDVGIGGGTAEVVGNLLRELGSKAQVLCITHLPQVAACAHHHMQVQKHTNKNITSTNIITLAKQPRVEEIARMLGGVKITEKTLKHAEEMLDA